MQKFISFIGLILFLFTSCTYEHKVKSYLSNCNDRKSALWCTYQTEQYQVVTQYRPPLLCALDEIRTVKVKEAEVDSIQEIYSEYYSYKLYLTDYFIFQNENVLENVSISPELSLEDYLRSNIFLVADGDTISNSNIQVTKTYEKLFPMCALVYFRKNKATASNKLDLFYVGSGRTNKSIKLSETLDQKINLFKQL